MKLAVSNIAWPAGQDEAVATALTSLAVEGVEIAPTKVWPAPLEASGAAIDAYRRFWESRGIAIVAAQSLLFGRPDLTLFDDPETRRRTLEYLRGIVRLCGRLGARTLVFGSPRNRRIGNGDRTVAWQAAVDFFGDLGEAANLAGAVIGIEANPPEYDADFLIRAEEAVALVRAVNHPGFQLHLDAACMTLAGDPVSLIGENIGLLHHFHISEPSLGKIGTGAVPHAAFAHELRTKGYNRWVSIEMREQQPFSVDALSDTIRYALGIYR